MTLRIHLVQDRAARDALARLRDDHDDVRSTFERSERVAHSLLEGVSAETSPSRLSPWIVLRGGLVAWRPLRDLDWGPIGMLAPARQGPDSAIVYASGPQTGTAVPLVVDWIMATGSTVSAAVQHVAEAQAQAEVSVAVVLSCVEGETRLDTLDTTDVDLYCFEHGHRAGGLLLGYDIGDYALGYGGGNRAVAT